VSRGQKKSAELRVDLKDAKRLKFSGVLSDLDERVGTLDSRMGSSPGSRHDSAAKIHDQEKRKHDNQIATGTMRVGILSDAVVVNAD
jgi:hypothetical protein